MKKNQYDQKQISQQNLTNKSGNQDQQEILTQQMIEIDDKISIKYNSTTIDTIENNQQKKLSSTQNLKQQHYQQIQKLFELKQNITAQEIAQKVKISLDNARKLKKQYLKTGSLIKSIDLSNNDKLRKYKNDKQKARQITQRQILKNRRITIPGIMFALAEGGIDINRQTVQRCARDVGYVKRKIKRITVEGTNAQSVQIRRKYCKTILNCQFSKIIFIDEYKFDQNTSLQYYWADKDQLENMKNPVYNQQIHNDDDIIALAIVTQKGFQSIKFTQGSFSKQVIDELINQMFINFNKDKYVFILNKSRLSHIEIYQRQIANKNYQILYFPDCFPQLNPMQTVFAELKFGLKLQRKYERIPKNQMLQLLNWSAGNIKKPQFERYFSRFKGNVQKGANDKPFI